MLKTKLELFREQYPDAVEYNDKTQAFVSEEAAREKVYGKKTTAKLLFSNSIASINGVRQQYIFSMKALEKEEVCV